MILIYIIQYNSKYKYILSFSMYIISVVLRLQIDNGLVKKNARMLISFQCEMCGCLTVKFKTWQNNISLNKRNVSTIQQGSVLWQIIRFELRYKNFGAGQGKFLARNIIFSCHALLEESGTHYCQTTNLTRLQSECIAPFLTSPPITDRRYEHGVCALGRVRDGTRGHRAGLVSSTSSQQWHTVTSWREYLGPQPLAKLMRTECGFSGPAVRSSMLLSSLRCSARSQLKMRWQWPGGSLYTTRERECGSSSVGELTNSGQSDRLYAHTVSPSWLISTPKRENSIS